MVTVHVFRVLSAIWQHFQLPTGQINTNIRHCVEVWLIRAITPLSLGPLVHSFCRATAKQPSYLPLHIHNGQLHSSARPVAHERGAGHDLQHQNHPPPCSEQCGSLPPSVRSEALQANTDRGECTASYHGRYPHTVISFNCDSPVAAWTTRTKKVMTTTKHLKPTSCILHESEKYVLSSKQCYLFFSSSFFFPPFCLVFSCGFCISSEMSTT